jgi:hypothetical protein
VPDVLRTLLLDYLLRPGRPGAREILFRTPASRSIHHSTCNRVVAGLGEEG